MTAASKPVPIPIAFCITELDRGGAEKAFTELVLSLDRQYWKARVFCLGPRSYFVEVLEANGIEVVCFNGRGVGSFPGVLWRLTRALRQFRPALLQTFLFHGNLIGRLAGCLAGVPHIVAGIRVAERRCRWHVRLDRWTNSLVDHNVCVSQGVADFSVQEAGLKARKVSVIPNGVDFANYANASPTDLGQLGLKKQFPVVITVGRLEEQKGIRFLLNAATTVLQQHPDCQFLIVGDGPERPSLAAMASSLGIGSSIHFAGHRGDVPGLLKASDLFVLPSLWEGMPNALLEAMAAGLPVIASAVEGSREIIKSDESGLLVPAGNSSELATAILRVLNDPHFASRLVSQSQDDVAKIFTNIAATAAYDHLYRQLISTR
ncbi:MAG TPA: glycosyltransferase [Schlesneria sp.]|jgi:glycosyltransferase involved in cell wall biosynthesis